MSRSTRPPGDDRLWGVAAPDDCVAGRDRGPGPHRSSLSPAVAPPLEHQQQVEDVDGVVAVDVGRAAGAASPARKDVEQVEHIDGAVTVGVGDARPKPAGAETRVSFPSIPWSRRSISLGRGT